MKKAAEKEGKEDPKKSEKKSILDPRKLSLADVRRAIEKKLGDKVLRRGDSVEVTKRVPFGIYPLDYAIGGGWPVGKFMQFAGPEHSNKTTLALRALAMLQRTCVECYDTDYLKKGCACGKMAPAQALWVDAERSWDKVWVAQQGVDPSTVELNTPRNGEEGVEVADTFLRSGAVDMIVIDSIAELQPEYVQDQEAGKNKPGNHAQLIHELCTKLLSGQIGLDRDFGKLVTIIFVNQFRDKITMFGDPTTTTGGKRPKFVAALELYCKRPKYELDAAGFPLIAEFEFKVQKNKTCRSTNATGTYKLLLGETEDRAKGSVLDEQFVVDMAEEAGIVTGSGSHYHAMGRDFRGKSDVAKTMLKDEAFGYELRKQTRLVHALAMA